MNLDRRNFLKLLLIGTGGFFLTRILPQKLFSLSSNSDKSKTASSRRTQANSEKEIIGKNFKFAEKEGKLAFFNKKGKQVFSVDEEGSLEIGADEI